MRDPELPDRHARRVIAERFSGHWQRGYVRCKLSSDPVYAATARVLAAAPPLPLLDVGCGMGLLGQYLHACKLLHGYRGIDHDERKILAGRQAAAGMHDAFELQRADVVDLPDLRGHVTLLDVLHYLPAARQYALLCRLAGHVAPAGLLVLRNVLRQRNWRFRATLVEEKLLHLSGWMRVGAIHYPSVTEICTPLEATELKVTVTPLWGHTPFNSYMVVARR